MNKNPNQNDLPPLLREDERECCKETETPQGEQPHDCVDNWKEQVKAAANALNIASATAGKAQADYSNASKWENALKKWLESAQNAHDKAHNVFAELNRFLPTVERIQTNTARTTTTVQALLCLVKTIFDQVLSLSKTSTSAEESKGLLQSLKLYIECRKDLDEKKKQEALEAIEPYESKVTAIYGLRENLLNKLLEILRCADALAAAMGTPGAEKDLGLRWQLNDLRARIIGETTAKAKQQACGCSEPAPNQTAVDPPCGKEISMPSARLLPIRAMTVEKKQLPDSAYYADLKKLYETAQTDSATYNTKMNEAKKASDNAAARKASLDAAIAAAGAAETAK